MDNKRKSLLLCTVSIILVLTSSIIISQVITQDRFSSSPSFPIVQAQQVYTLLEDSPHLLIILSPQYANDPEIRIAINTYQLAIKAQPGWNSNSIFLTSQTNQIESITAFIQTTYQQNNLTAVLLIGEDLLLPIKTNYQNIQKPDLLRYSTINSTNENHPEITICVSLLFPSPLASYQEKQSQLIQTLHRFSTTRSMNLTKPSTIIEQASLASYSHHDYHSLSLAFNASYQQNMKPSELTRLLHYPSDLLSFHGHGSPSRVQLSDSSSFTLTSDLVSSLKTTILSIDGCYTDSIYNDLNSSQTPFISTICSSDTMHIGFFGLLSQQTATQKENIINTILSHMTNGSTIAEIINTAQIPFDFVFTGDPTFQIQ